MFNTSSILRTATGLAVAAVIAAPLASCSGATRALPAASGGSAAQSRQMANPFNARVVAIPDAAKFVSEAQRRAVRHDVSPGASKSCLKGPFIYTSDNPTGDLDVFCEDSVKKAPNALVGTVNQQAGWGLAVIPVKMPPPPPSNPCTGSQELLAVGVNPSGSSPGTIYIYCNLAAGAAMVKMNSAPLALTQGYPLGICWDQSGGIYATEFPSNTIAHFTYNQLRTGGTATTTFTTSVNVVQYQVACDYDKLMINEKPKGENYLIAFGYDANGNVNITNVSTSGGGVHAETVEQTLGSYGTTAFPGGLAIDTHDDLVANNQLGTMYDFNPELWNSPARGSCTWGYNPNDYVGIAFDDTQRELWAADTNFGGTTYGQSNRFPFSGSACTQGESGYQTQHPIGAEASYYGIAVWPNRGV